MFCNNCGKEIADDVVFCTSCGVRVKGAAPVGAAPSETEKNEPDITPANEAAAVGVDEEMTFVPPPPPAAPEEPQKQYFGLGGLVFCLILIGLLSISTGIFAGLYFSLR